MKKGPGYRSSFSGNVATVFGAGGMVGRSVMNRFGQNGTQIIVPYRGDFYWMQRLKLVGDLGQVLFTPFDLRDEESIRRSMRHSNVVVNLIGKEYETFNFKFRDVNTDGARRIARIAREEGVDRLIHISAMNAKEHPDKLFTPNGSEWLRSKWFGEQAVLEEFPDATIFRPSEMYGEKDTFLNYYFNWARWGFWGNMPMYRKGNFTTKRPLFYADLGDGIMAALETPASKGVVYEAYGPQAFLLSEIMDWMCEKTNRDPKDYNYGRSELIYSPYALAKTLVIERLPTGQKKAFGPQTLEKLERSQLSEEVLGLPSLENLGVKPHYVVDKMPFEFHQHRAYAHYRPELAGEIPPVVEDPVPLSMAEERNMVALNREEPLYKALLPF